MAVENIELAIVIPYYKITFFEATLQSLVSQINKRFNVYIGDDASPEDPYHILEKYQARINFTYKRYDSNFGKKSLTHQWERCIEMVQSESWVVILGDDDTFSNNFVAAFYNHLNEINLLNINVIRYASIVINEHGKKISITHTHPQMETSPDFLMRKLKGGTRSSLSEFIFRKDVLNRIKFKNLPLAWFSDYLAVLECSNFNNIYTINNALVFFRLSGLNITSKQDDLILKNISTFKFYYFLLEKKVLFFNKEQQKQIYLMIEKTFLDNKRNVEFWKLFTLHYLKKMRLAGYLRFLFKVLYSVLKK
jgi:glycosyltransferase involved in cell wall biosynthesis